MADAYWSYGNPRYHQAHAPDSAMIPSQRPRTDYLEAPGDPERMGYYPRKEERVGYPPAREQPGPFDPFLRNEPVPSFGAGETARSGFEEMTRRPIDDMQMPVPTDGRTVRYGDSRLEKPLPPDASKTLFVEGLPVDCTRREVSHVFRPFPGFCEVRLVTKESKRPGGELWVLCFADFNSPKEAATALDCLQDYRFDEHDRLSSSLRLQFSRFPGPRNTGGPRGRC